jgi:hypothetical protein
VEREREIGSDEKVRIVKWRSGEFYRGFVSFGRDEGAISIVRGDGAEQKEEVEAAQLQQRPAVDAASARGRVGGEGGWRTVLNASRERKLALLHGILSKYHPNGELAKVIFSAEV